VSTIPTYLFSGNAAYLESLYEAYLADPSKIEDRWRVHFDALRGDGGQTAEDVSHAGVRAALVKAAAGRPKEHFANGSGESAGYQAKQVSVLQLINAYRFRGHRQADLDPLDQTMRPSAPDLSLEYHGLGKPDLDTVFNAGSLQGVARASLREILDILSVTYCGPIGSEYMHITETEQKRWIQERLEPVRGNPEPPPEGKRRILDRLVAANVLETYLHAKYVGQKRFSLEGGESLIPLLDDLIDRASGYGTKEIVIGMAHRGRLNVLVNTLGVRPADLFQEFEGKVPSGNGSGDVKYHKGFSSDLRTAHGAMHLVLAFNPSHLEIINPVVEGSVRARQERRGDRQRKQVLPVLLHGDAAFAGQGVVMETLNLSQTRGYSTGGTIHIVINNQIGFTTSDPLDSRSTLYCTDVAKMVQAPIFHVNGDDPEAVCFVIELALDFRMAFGKDVVVDMVCYRRWGHNEADEPMATQPVMYQRIKDHLVVAELYAKALEQEGVTKAGEYPRLAEEYQRKLDNNEVLSGPHMDERDSAYLVDYHPFSGTHWTAAAETRLDRDRVLRLSDAFTRVPEDFVLHKAVSKVLTARQQMGRGEIPLDWGFAETLAYASLIEDGYQVRLSGQDSARGTFFHRHAVIHDQNSGRTHVPLQHLFENQPSFLPINSILSEEAVLGFELGYAYSEPNALVIWEAQYGDFANMAQAVIDQFLSSSESKWRRYIGLVLFLPHGYEGQGPEHSSGRLERYLQLCAEENMQVCVPSTPAQMFHMLRRQILRPYRKPLIVMSPKSLLRNKLSTSPLEDITDRYFQTVIDEIDPISPIRVTRVLFCSGKVYFDLLEARREHGIEDIAIVRIEQQYPFPLDDVRAVLDRYPHARSIIWVQEEPRNQGAWRYMQSHRNLKLCLSSQHNLDYVGRTYSASPAVGYLQVHIAQQKRLVADALQLHDALP
jgi:2-oxoglutarate dehydrogenase E1 component